MPDMQKKKIVRGKKIPNTPDRTRSTKPEANVPKLQQNVTGNAQIKYDPNQNPRAISIILQDDGNYIGECQKFGRLVSIRDIGPETVLQRLLTHDGKEVNG